MGSITNWIEDAQEIAIFKGGGSLGGIAGKPLLEISKTNRVTGLVYSRLAIAVRLIAKYLGADYNDLVELVSSCEEYQLTIGESKNSREAYLESIKYQFGHYLRPSETGKPGRGITGL
jgi:hypothetical protein